RSARYPALEQSAQPPQVERFLHHVGHCDFDSVPDGAHCGVSILGHRRFHQIDEDAMNETSIDHQLGRFEARLDGHDAEIAGLRNAMTQGFEGLHTKLDTLLTIENKRSGIMA